MEYRVLHTTVDDEDVARKLASEAVTQRLAACVQIVTIQSVYQWQGELETSSEFRCEMKTRTDCVDALRQLVRRHHTYELPEIVELELCHLSPEYQAWLDEQLASA